VNNPKKGDKKPAEASYPPVMKNVFCLRADGSKLSICLRFLSVGGSAF